MGLMNQVGYCVDDNAAFEGVMVANGRSNSVLWYVSTTVRLKGCSSMGLN